MDETTLDGATVVQRLFQRVENEPGRRLPADPPADDPPGEGVDDEGDMDEARPGRDVGEVGDPEPVRAVGAEHAVHPVQRARRARVGNRRPHPPAPDGSLQAQRPHQPGDGAAGDRNTLAS
jgi:hypothetical protein